MPSVITCGHMIFMTQRYPLNNRGHMINQYSLWTDFMLGGAAMG